MRFTTVSRWHRERRDTSTRWRVLVLAAFIATLANAASVTMPNESVNAGDTVLVSVAFSSPNQAVSAIQFDLSWDPSLSVNVATGGQVGASNKTLSATLLQPRDLRCMVWAMNGKALSDGEVLRIYVTTPAGAATGIGQLALQNLSAAAPDGTPVALQGNWANVQFLAGTITQVLQPSGIVNGASFLSGPVSPGEVITLFGSISNIPVILFNGVPAPIFYANSNQVNAVVPFGLNISKPAQVQIQQGTSIATTQVPVAAASPGILTQSTTGTGPGAILNQDYSVNSSVNPAAPGDVVMVYGTGFGVLNPLPPDGQLATVLATPGSAVSATIDGVPAGVIYAGAAPGLINGAIQVNVTVPAGAKPNPAAAISLTMGSFTTQPGVTVSIR